MKAFETITIRTVAKGSNLSRKAIVKAIEELGVEAYYMRMKAYGARGHVGQIKLEDAEKVIAKATEYKEEPKQPKVSKLELLKANGFEILSETKTQYRLSKDGVTRSVGKSKSIAKILEKFETKPEEVKEEVEPEIIEIDPVTGIEGVEVEDEFGEKLEEGEDTSLDINKLYELYAKKDEAAKREVKDVDEEIEPQIVEEVKKEPASVKQYSEFVPQIKKALEKEHPGTEVKNVIVMDKVDDNHFWVNWNGIDHNSTLGNMETFSPLEEVTIEE